MKIQEANSPPRAKGSWRRPDAAAATTKAPYRCVRWVIYTAIDNIYYCVVVTIQLLPTLPLAQRVGNVLRQVKSGERAMCLWSAPRGPPPPPPSPCAAALRRRRLYEQISALRRRRLYEQMLAVPAAAGHSFGVGCLHPVLDGGQEPLEAKVREGRHTLV